jgi:hypothetical protein
VEAAWVRDYILSLPEVTEYDHGGLPAFRVRGKRFGSMLDDEGMNLMVGEEAIRAAVALWPDACRENHFAGRLASVRVTFGKLDRETTRELVFDAWAHRAPKRLHAAGLAAARGDQPTAGEVPST